MRESTTAANKSRIVLAGTHSGSGKTTVTCALLGALKRRGLKPVAFKCGPDYLDPMFHRQVIGVESVNLDPFFLDKNGLCSILCSRSAGYDVAVLEGVMGYYDGTGKNGMEYSTFSVADDTSSGVLLVVNGKGASTSILAQIKGFLEFVPESRICGVIINQISEGMYERLQEQLEHYFGGKVRAVGYLPPLPKECILESRHLGLVLAEEIADLKEKMELLGTVAEKSLDIGAILELAGQSPKLQVRIAEEIPVGHGRIAVARDRAFCFYYADTFRLWERLGAELVFFSPLNDEAVPENCCGLYLGGGYPELYLQQLSEAEQARQSILAALKSGMPLIAECGGFMYLNRSIEGVLMCGFFSGECERKERLVRFGYVELGTDKNGVFGNALPLKGHEFHYYDSTENGADMLARRRNGTEHACCFYNEQMYAGYPHLYLGSAPDSAREFYRRCLKFQKEKEGKDGVC